MPEHSGIYTVHQTSPLIFVMDRGELKGELLSSIQSFETSLLMIGLGRWTNALVSLSNAIEMIVKTAGSLESSVDFIDLIDSFCRIHSVSEDLRQCAHRVRKTRNDYVHRSVIPDDNDDAIMTFMSDGLSVYKVFLMKTVDVDLYESIESPNLRRNIVLTKNLLKQKKDDLHVGLYLSVLVKTVANQIHHFVTPERLFDVPHQNRSWMVLDDVKSELERWVEGTFDDLDFIHDQVSCPCDCDGMLSLGVEASTDKGVSISVAYCTYCGLTIFPHELIRVFVLDPLGIDAMRDIRKSYGIIDQP